MRNRKVFILISLMIGFALLLMACGASGTPATSAPVSGGTLDGLTLVQQRCSACHSIDRVTSRHKTADQWKSTVDRMVANGAQLSPQEEQVLVDYLAQNYK